MMKKSLLLAALFMASQPLAAVETVNLAPGPGVKIFLGSDHRCDYWRLINYFDTQLTDAYCGVASSVMVLNAIGIKKPFVERLGCPLFTQEEGFFTPQVLEIVQPEQVLIRGMTIPQLAQALSTFNLNVTPLYASEMSLDTFRRLLQTALIKPNQFLIANFFRPLLNQKGGGHFSPIAAYNAQTDQLLILDVSRYKYPPFWVAVEDFYTSMRTLDPGSDRSRGIIFISH